MGPRTTTAVRSLTPTLVTGPSWLPCSKHGGTQVTNKGKTNIQLATVSIYEWFELWFLLRMRRRRGSSQLSLCDWWGGRGLLSQHGRGIWPQGWPLDSPTLRLGLMREIRLCRNYEQVPTLDCELLTSDTTTMKCQVSSIKYQILWSWVFTISFKLGNCFIKF